MWSSNNTVQPNGLFKDTTGEKNGTELTDFGSNLRLTREPGRMDHGAAGKRPGCMGILLSGFADDCGISGMKFLAGKSVVPLRRIVWLLVLLAGLGLLSYQIWDRVSYFVDYPLNVNVKLNYVEELTFPAIAICNFNMFTLTYTNEVNLTGILYEMYGTFNPNFDNYDIEITTSEQFYRDAAQQPSSMFYTATWQWRPMELDAVQSILTDFGACYAFNTGNDKYGVRKVRSKGTSHGLSVNLDVNQWDYNVGPRVGAGFQLMLYEQGDVPLISDLGFAVAPGEDVRVGIEVTKVVNLPPPHGICGEKSLKYYNRYSVNACQMECKTDHVVEHCGCKAFFMPGNANVCDVKQYYNCLQYAEFSFTNKTCDCPVPCTQVIYKPSLSHAKYPSDAYATYLESAYGYPREVFTANMAKVDVYFQELSVTEITQEKAYGVFALLCDIGGSLGLWLGGSILTVMEIIDIFLKGCCRTSWH
ncbi:acid-sensing ion channel 1C-like isoform X1 [Ptychodera flava]|uniref:acid-sensing ion channel 1C-like isoform X1 n=1 Tax=Ptychodera flava TaxID=63121 RepID=UPI003969DB5E